MFDKPTLSCSRPGFSAKMAGAHRARVATHTMSVCDGRFRRSAPRSGFEETLEDRPSPKGLARSNVWFYCQLPSLREKALKDRPSPFTGLASRRRTSSEQRLVLLPASVAQRESAAKWQPLALASQRAALILPAQPASAFQCAARLAASV